MWFNPAIYIYQKSIHAVHEFLADEKVVNLHGTESYQHYLFNSLKQLHTELSTVNPFHSLIKNRVHMLNNKKESTKTIFLFAIPLLACLTFFISCEKTTKVIPLDENDLSSLKYTDEGNIIVTDTIVVFDDETFEEEVRFVTSEITPEEYLLGLQIANDSYIESNNEPAANSDLITVVDTVVYYNADTNKEATKIIETKLTFEEYLERQKRISLDELFKNSTTLQTIEGQVGENN